MHEPIHLTYDQFEPVVFPSDAKDLVGSLLKDNGFLKDFGIFMAVSMFFLFLLGYLQGDNLDVLGILLGAIGMAGVVDIERRRATRNMSAQTRRVGPYKIQIDATGFNNATSDSNFHRNWRAIDAISIIVGGTGLVTASCVYPLPDSGLPKELSPEDFRKTLEIWRAAAH